MKQFFWLSLLAVSLVLGGCATDMGPRPHLTGDPLVDGPAAIARGPAKDKLLWQYRMAAQYMRRGQYAEAKPLLDDALASIGGIFGRDKDAKKARGYFNAEAKKTFLGEPYERVMAYYYRGILYWMDGEPDNARACFRSAQLQDSDTEQKAYASDYVLLDYLDGLASTKLGGDGSDAFKRSQPLAKIAVPPAYNPKANVLFFVEFGPGPTKYATGQYAQELHFRGGVSPVKNAVIKVANFHVEVAPYDDLYFQATTRGGRAMDHILANKAVFKKTTDTIGNAAIVSGAILAGTKNPRRSSNQDEIGLGLVLAGLASKIVSAAATPEADIRAWDNLPLYLSFAAVQLPPGTNTVTVEFLDQHHQVVPTFNKTITLAVPSDGRDKVVFLSDQSVTPQTL